MKFLFAPLLLLSLVLTAPAAEWGVDYAAALKKAKQENKVVILDFTGSDWCAACMKLKKDVFSTPEFADFAKKHLVLVEVDFPMKKKISPEQKAANEKLEQQFNVEGYPTVVLVDPSGKKLGAEEGYANTGPKPYLQRLQEIIANGRTN